MNNSCSGTRYPGCSIFGDRASASVLSPTMRLLKWFQRARAVDSTRKVLLSNYRAPWPATSGVRVLNFCYVAGASIRYSTIARTAKLSRGELDFCPSSLARALFRHA
jgi:hypothetical protein